MGIQACIAAVFFFEYKGQVEGWGLHKVLNIPHVCSKNNTFFCNVISDCFQNHCHLLRSQKQTKLFFKVSRRLFLVLN